MIHTYIYIFSILLYNNSSGVTKVFPWTINYTYQNINNNNNNCWMMTFSRATCVMGNSLFASMNFCPRIILYCINLHDIRRELEDFITMRSHNIPIICIYYIIHIIHFIRRECMAQNLHRYIAIILDITRMRLIILYR